MNRFDQEEEKAVLDVIRSGRLSGFYKDFAGGECVQRFEKAFAGYVGRNYAISVSNGTTALHTAILASVKRDLASSTFRSVATSCASFISTATSILMAEKIPVFFDVDPVSFNIIPQKFRQNTIIPVDLLGVPCDMKEIRELNPFATIVEDACQALGSFYKSGKVGAYADVSCYSFQETKTMTTAGEGGMVCTDDGEIAERARNIRNHGNQYANADYLTYNYRMTEIQAAFGLAQLKKLPLLLGQQEENARYIIQHLPQGISYPAHVFGGQNYYILGCVYDERAAGLDRENFIERLALLGVNRNEPGRTVSLGYQKLIYERPLFAPYLHHPCLVAEGLKKTWLWLDIHRWRPLEEVKADVDLMHEALR